MKSVTKNANAEIKEWREWIQKIAIRYKDNKEEFYSHFDKHVREEASEDKHLSTINMVAILECMDGRDPIDSFVFETKELLKKLREYKEKHGTDV